MRMFKLFQRDLKSLHSTYPFTCVGTVWNSQPSTQKARRKTRQKCEENQQKKHIQIENKCGIMLNSNEKSFQIQ